jgi:hypothetical protein
MTAAKSKGIRKIQDKIFMLIVVLIKTGACCAIDAADAANIE